MTRQISRYAPTDGWEQFKAFCAQENRRRDNLKHNVNSASGLLHNFLSPMERRRLLELHEQLSAELQHATVVSAADILESLRMIERKLSHG